jgi:hypothetical protein
MIIRQECLYAVGAEKLVSIINHILRYITLSRQSHVNSLATTGEYKEYTNRDVQNLIHSYSGKPKQTVRVSMADRIFSYLRKLQTIKNVKTRRGECSFLAGYGDLRYINNHSHMGEYVSVTVYNITQNRLFIEIEYHENMIYVAERIVTKYAGNPTVVVFDGEAEMDEPLNPGDELPNPIYMMVKFPPENQMPVFKRIITTVVKMASKPPV